MRGGPIDDYTFEPGIKRYLFSLVTFLSPSSIAKLSNRGGDTTDVIHNYDINARHDRCVPIALLRDEFVMCSTDRVPGVSEVFQSARHISVARGLRPTD